VCFLNFILSLHHLRRQSSARCFWYGKTKFEGAGRSIRRRTFMCAMALLATSIAPFGTVKASSQINGSSRFGCPKEYSGARHAKAGE